MEGHVRVLLVEDDAASRAMLALSLRQAGFEVDAVPSAEAALRALGAGQYRWLVTDAFLEAMDGFELSIRAVALRPALRVVMISAVCVEGDIAQYPIERIFAKPVPLESLILWLRSPWPPPPPSGEGAMVQAGNPSL